MDEQPAHLSGNGRKGSSSRGIPPQLNLNFESGQTNKQKKEMEEIMKNMTRTSESIFQPDEQEAFEFDYYFKDVKLASDVSKGQRNYERNLDALLEQLL